MKKISLVVLAMCAVVLVNAQVESGTGYKHYAGARNLEVQFAPLGGTPISIGGLKFRSFSTDDSALRLNVFLGISNDTDKRTETDSNGDDVTLKNANSSFSIQVKPGFENHFAGTERLSPYYGVEGVIGFRTSSAKTETLAADDDILTTKNKNPNNDGYFRLGANAILGADYYFAKSIYLGTEVGFGFQFDLEHDDVVVPDDGDDITNSEGGVLFNFGPNVVGQIRLGFLF